MNVSVNKGAARIVEQMIKDHDKLNIKVEELEGGAKYLDMGVAAPGGYEAGRLMTEVCMGGFGQASLAMGEYGGVSLPVVTVTTDCPSISLLGSQFAGWKISVEKYFAMGSGPARAIPMKPKELYAKIGYQDSSDVAVIILETSEKPGGDVVKYIANECSVEPKNVYILAAPTSCVAGSVQISGRSAETGLHKLSEVGLDPKCVVHAVGQAPIAPVHPKMMKAMGRTNDMILYAGMTFYTAVVDDDEVIAKAVEKTPSSTAPAYGNPFYDIFKAADFDFYKIDPGLFAPAAIAVNSAKTGKTYTAGTANIEVLKKSIGL